MNRRVARQDGTVWTEYVHDPEGHLLAELVRPATAGGAWATNREYAWLDGQPLAQLEYLSSRATPYAYYFHLDHLGEPRALTNETGSTTVWSAVPARPYGDVAETTTADPLSGKTVVTNLRLPGQYDERLLSSVGLQGPYYNWSRWYLPTMGRYMELDPIALSGGFNGPWGPNWYGYAEGNPLLNTDPFGLADRSQLCASLAARIQNIEQKISQRIGELDENPLGLPEACPGDKQNPSLSRSGHRMLINMDKAQLAALKAQYALMCGNFGPPPFSNPYPFQPPTPSPFGQNQSPQASPLVPTAAAAGALGTAAAILLIIILLPVGL